MPSPATSESTHPAKAISIAALSLVVIIGSIWGIKQLQHRAQQQASANFSLPPSPVNAFVVDTQVWPSSLDAVGTIEAEEGVTILSEVAGRVLKLHFISGETVVAGTLLLEQDNGNEKAQLESARATLRLAKATHDRLSALRKQSLVSESQFETAQQNLDSADANVRNLQTSLEKKQIKAPFAGRLGIRKIDLGQELQAGEPIVSLQGQKQLKVNFTMPQRFLAHIKTGLDVSVSMLEISEPTYTGTINAIGTQVDEATRSIEIQATLDDGDQTLVPGMAAKVSVHTAEEKTYLVVPVTAVVFSAHGDTVFVLDKSPDNGQLLARQQFIDIAERRGDFVAVKTGLKAGEQVASSGAFKLYNGQPVAISERPETPYSLKPKPNDA